VLLSAFRTIEQQQQQENQIKKQQYFFLSLLFTISAQLGALLLKKSN